jgi:hypothetical protein
MTLCSICNKMVFLWSVSSLKPNIHAAGSPLIDCPRLLIQYISSYPPYMEGFYSVRNPRTHLAVVTRDPLNMEYNQFTQRNIIGNAEKFLLMCHFLLCNRVVQVQVESKIWKIYLTCFSYIFCSLAPFIFHKLLIITVAFSVSKNASTFHFTNCKFCRRFVTKCRTRIQTSSASVHIQHHQHQQRRNEAIRAKISKYLISSIAWTSAGFFSRPLRRDQGRSCTHVQSLKYFRVRRRSRTAHS